MLDSGISVDILYLGKPGPGRWLLGKVFEIRPSTSAVEGWLSTWQADATADAVLVWDPGLGAPDPAVITALLRRRGDVWHAGLLIGTSGLPAVIDFVSPTWMLNRDPDPNIDATSWRISLRACLIRTGVLVNLGGLRAEFETLEGAALELGHRYIKCGALVRHAPFMLPAGSSGSSSESPTLKDELRFVLYCYGRKWARWATLRLMLAPGASVVDIFRVWISLRKAPIPELTAFLSHDIKLSPGTSASSVSVLIPTLGRYPYLRKLLGQLRGQTIPAVEIIIVDQTPPPQRIEHLAVEFPDLPLRILHLDRAGQCSSRNAGLLDAVGEYILLADDDIEVEPNFIEAHLATIQSLEADSSSGIAHEVGLPLEDRYAARIKLSDVFPAGITLVRRSALTHSGLFDLAFEHGQRADGDLGMRIYLSGGRMVLNSDISVLHHRAARGGLRTHKARVVTRRSSRSRIFQRHLPSASEVYLAMRYFNGRQVREALLIRLLGTLLCEGKRHRKIATALVNAAALPHTIYAVLKRRAEAGRMMTVYPQIPEFPLLRDRTEPVREAANHIH